jgi:hypothetical protein
MVTAPAQIPLPRATPFDRTERDLLADVSLRAELLSRKLELLRVIGAPDRAPELQNLEGLLLLVAHQIDGLLAHD